MVQPVENKYKGTSFLHDKQEVCSDKINGHFIWDVNPERCVWKSHQYLDSDTGYDSSSKQPHGVLFHYSTQKMFVGIHISSPKPPP